MKLSDITTESHLSIRAVIEDNETEVPIKMAVLEDADIMELNRAIHEPFIPLEVVVQEYEKKMQVVSFHHHQAKLSLVAVHEDELYIWNNIRVEFHTLNSGKKVHLLVTMSNVGEKYNRRRGVRIDFHRHMDVRQNGKNLNILVKDISYCGIGFIEFGESKLDPNAPFVLMLTDEEDGNKVLVGKITGKVIRQETTEGGVTLSGCIVAKDHYAFLQKYLAIKQLEQIRGKPSYKSVQKMDESEDWKNNVKKRLEKETLIGDVE